jgi:hypothetical protein
MIASSSSSYRRCLKRLQLLKEGCPAPCPQLAIRPGACLEDPLRARSRLGSQPSCADPNIRGTVSPTGRALGRPDLRQKGVPTSPAKIETLLEEILTDRDHENWQRTKTRRLKALLEHQAPLQRAASAAPFSL